MNVLRHHDISQHDEAVTPPDAFEYLEEQIPVRDALQERLALIAAECQKVEIAATIEAMRMIRHGERVQKETPTCL